MVGARAVSEGWSSTPPVSASLRRGPEASGKLGRKVGSRGPGAARGRRRGGSGDPSAGDAGPPSRRPCRRRASRATPECRTQRPHHPRQAQPLRQSGGHYTGTRDVGRSAAYVTAGSLVRTRSSAQTKQPAAGARPARSLERRPTEACLRLRSARPSPPRSPARGAGPGFPSWLRP